MTTTLTDISEVLDEDCGLLPNLFESGDELLVDRNVLVGTLNHDDLTGSEDNDLLVGLSRQT